MSKRRDSLKDFLSPVVLAGDVVRPIKPAVQSGALNSMNQAIANLADEAERAERLESQIAAGETIIEIEPDLIRPSFVKDRLGDFAGPDFIELRESLRSVGQIIPVLVRPYPSDRNLYQLAFGHRRVEALRQLGKPVKAIVRELSDDELIVAQGKENTDRTDLSFIEKALFALRLETKGVTRHVIMDALTTTSKGVLSGMISLVRSLPVELLEGIGPAPSIGRPRWEMMATLVATGEEQAWRSLISDEKFCSLDSDARFERVFGELRVPHKSTNTEQTLKSNDGREIASVQKTKKMTKLTFQSNQTGGFADFITDNLPRLYLEFSSRNANGRS